MEAQTMAAIVTRIEEAQAKPEIRQHRQRR